MSAVASPARCTATHQWTGVGRRAHSSGSNPTFVCTLLDGHDGAHLYERVAAPRPAPVRVAELPAPRTPTPVQPDTLARVQRGRLFFQSTWVRPLPTTEEEAQRELLSQKIARAPSGRLAAHYFRRWLDTTGGPCLAPACSRSSRTSPHGMPTRCITPTFADATTTRSRA